MQLRDGSPHHPILPAACPWYLPRGWLQFPPVREAEADLQDEIAQKETLQRDVTKSLAEINRLKEDLDKVALPPLSFSYPCLLCPRSMREK